MSNSDLKTTISIIVTVHREGIILHHTLQSVLGAIRQLTKGATAEIIVHADNPDTETSDYIQRLTEFIPNTIPLQIFTNHFGNPGASRNFCITHAHGEYIAFIDGDDLMSDNWLADAYETVSASKAPRVAHSEYTIEFGGTNSIVKKYSAIDKPTDALLSVWAGRWNAIIFAPKKLIEKLGYPEAKNGYGYEDWEMSCRLIAADVENVTIPNTVMFVRRKLSNSVFAQHNADKAVIHRNDCLSFKYIRSIDEPATFRSIGGPISLPARVERYRNSSALPIRAARKLYRIAKKYRRAPTSLPSSSGVPDWLLSKWELMHNTDRRIFPLEELVSTPALYESLTEDHYRVGHAYKQIVDQTTYDNYDYLFFVPWLINGGADLYTVNLANEALSLYPNMRIGIVATMPLGKSTRPEGLDQKIDFISFAPAIDRLETFHVDRLLEQFIENSGATTLHVINSLQAYNFLETHRLYVKANNKRVIATSFSQSVDTKTGRLYGYSHTHVPNVYDLCTVITTDNLPVADMWVREYGFDRKKIQVIRPLVKLEMCHINQDTDSSSAPRVLWAARLAPEKLVEIVPQIAAQLPTSIEIDMYGTPGEDFDSTLLSSLPKNVIYKGPFTDFYSLPLSHYGVFLYTSLFDGMPNALVEATTANLPIVASNAGGISDFISSETGILIDDILDAGAYAQAISTLLDDPKRAQQLVAAARHKLDVEYSRDQFSQSVARLLQTIAK